MSKIKKAVIPAAGFGTRFLPATKSQPKEMLPIIDKPTIQFIVEEAIEAGIEEILIITSSQKRSIEDHFDKSWELEEFLKENNKNELYEVIKNISNMINIHYIRQKEAKGLGHAILQAKTFVGNDPFAILLGDDLFYNEKDRNALRSMTQVYNGQNILGFQKVKKEDVNKYGIIDAKEENNELIVNNLVEKPDIDKAPSQNAIVGRYILNPEIFDFLKNQKPGVGGEIQLTDSLIKLIEIQKTQALEINNERYDIGSKIDFLRANIEFGLRREDIKEDLKKIIKNNNE